VREAVRLWPVSGTRRLLDLLK